MILTPSLRKFVNNRIIFYCDILGIRNPDNLHIFFDIKTARIYGRLEGWKNKLSEEYLRYDILAEWFDYEPAIYFNIPTHQNRGQLENTIIHELIHARFPSLPHNDYFNDLIKKIRKGQIEFNEPVIYDHNTAKYKKYMTALTLE